MIDPVIPSSFCSVKVKESNKKDFTCNYQFIWEPVNKTVGTKDLEKFPKKNNFFLYILEIRNLDKSGDSESFRPYMFFGIFFDFSGGAPWVPKGSVESYFTLYPVILSSF